MTSDASTAGPWVKDVDTANFLREVIERSHQVPVVVDFWATWCAPCRVLGPILEKEIQALGGRVELVKIDTDANAELAAQFQVQGIPSVKAFRGGQLVADFVGAQPVDFIRTWLNALMPSVEAQTLIDAEKALMGGRTAEAETALRSLLDNPDVRDRAALMLARLAIHGQRPEELPALLARIDPRSEEADAIPALERHVAFARDAAAYGGEAKAREAIAADTKDLEAHYALGSALAARGAWREALEEFVGVAARNRKFKDDGARLAVLAIFDHLGPEHELTDEFRRRLQIVL